MEKYQAEPTPQAAVKVCFLEHGLHPRSGDGGPEAGPRKNLISD